MTLSFQMQNSDVAGVVVETFRRYLGTSDDLPLTSHLLTDLGIDSIVFVAAILEVADQLGLDLGTAQLDLGRLETLEDVVTFLRSLQG